MNDQQIETLLRKAPAPSVPAGLRENLQAGIQLPRSAAPRRELANSTPWIRRWLPALSFAAILLTCVVAIGVQMNTIDDLQRQNDALRADLQKITAAMPNDAEYKRLVNENQELDRLRRDSADLARLREEVEKMREQAAEVATLRAANQTMQQQLAARGVPANADSSGDFFSEAKARAERIMCVNNLKQIGLANRIWANDNNDISATNFNTMSNELSTPKILYCPSDKSITLPATNFVQPVISSYQLTGTGAKLTQDSANMVFVFCPIHNNYCLMDGSVQQLSPEAVAKHIKVIDGKTYLVSDNGQ